MRIYKTNAEATQQAALWNHLESLVYYARLHAASQTAPRNRIASTHNASTAEVMHRHYVVAQDADENFIIKVESQSTPYHATLEAFTKILSAKSNNAFLYEEEIGVDISTPREENEHSPLSFACTFLTHRAKSPEKEFVWSYVFSYFKLGKLRNFGPNQEVFLDKMSEEINSKIKQGKSFIAQEMIKNIYALTQGFGGWFLMKPLAERVLATAIEHADAGVISSLWGKNDLIISRQIDQKVKENKQELLVKAIKKDDAFAVSYFINNGANPLVAMSIDGELKTAYALATERNNLAVLEKITNSENALVSAKSPSHEGSNTSPRDILSRDGNFDSPPLLCNVNPAISVSPITISPAFNTSQKNHAVTITVTSGESPLATSPATSSIAGSLDISPVSSLGASPNMPSKNAWISPSLKKRMEEGKKKQEEQKANTVSSPDASSSASTSVDTSPVSSLTLSPIVPAKQAWVSPSAKKRMEEEKRTQAEGQAKVEASADASSSGLTYSNSN